MTDKTKEFTDGLYKLTREISVLSSCTAVLDWDERTYMPSKGSENRSNQVALLAGMAHEKLTAPRIGELINELLNNGLKPGDDSIDAANLREIKRAYDRAVKVPRSLVEELSKTITLAQRAWQEAREKSDFAAFKPWFEKIVKLKRQEAEAIGYQGAPYNAMLDDFEPGANMEKIAAVFAGLRDELVDLIDRIKSSGKGPDTGIITRDYPVDRQEQFGLEAARIIGFDFDSGRLDKTVHPFCSGFGPGDVRITTRYDKNFFPMAFFGILHEAGHGIYEQGLPDKHYGTPCGESVSLGIHESQSRMWENMVGRSKSFWQHFFPKAQKVFPEALKKVTLEKFHFAVNDVRPSFIRVEADEATYNLHILLRFELESAFFNDDLKVDDVPEAWTEKIDKYLGIKPPDDARGCLQDVHWSAGLIGYFPTYTLGNLYSAQFFAQARDDIGDLDSQFAKGDYSHLLGWLRKNIHSHGQRYRAEDLVKMVTGQPLSHKPLMDYLNAKFGELYGI